MRGESFVDGITKVLVKQKVITQQEARDLRKSFEDSEKANFDEFLLDEGLVDKDDLLVALAQLYEVPSFDAVGYLFDHELVRMFPKEFLIQHEIIPIERDEDMLFFVATDPSDENLAPAIAEYSSDDIHFRVGIRQDIIDSIQEFYDQSLAVDNPNIDEDYDVTRADREKEIHDAELLEDIYSKDIQESDE